MSKVFVLLAVIGMIIVSSSCQQINGPTDSDKQYALAKAYYEGHGIVRNYEKAYFWALVASANGEYGYSLLHKLEDGCLSQKQIIRIQNKALKWYNVNR